MHISPLLFVEDLIMGLWVCPNTTMRVSEEELSKYCSCDISSMNLVLRLPTIAVSILVITGTLLYFARVSQLSWVNNPSYRFISIFPVRGLFLGMMSLMEYVFV